MIPLIRPHITGKELVYIKELLEGTKLSGDGRFSQRCCELMQQKFGARSVLLTPSCTHALELAVLAANITQGDEVIMPSYTFVSTANSVKLRGAKPVFVDIRSDTLNVDEGQIEERITPRTRAIIPVHYAGVGAEMEGIMEIARKNDLLVIEDAAQAVNATYGGKYLGTMGDFGCFSFHDTKNHVCGEGGAILTNDPDFVDKVEVIREKGTNRKRFLRGEVDKYTWVDVGSSYLLSDLSAAFLLAQLESADKIDGARRLIHDRYVDALKDLEGLIGLPTIPENCISNGHLFYIITRSQKERERLFSYLRENGVYSTFHYVPLHLSVVGEKLGYKEGDFPVTESLASRIARLPIFPDLTSGEQEHIVDKIREFYKSDKN